jgi:hypothetical protein
MSRRKPAAVLAAATATLAIAVPAANASAAARSAAHTRAVSQRVAVTPNAILCRLLIIQLRFAERGNPTLVNLLGRTLQIQGCGGAAI